MRRRSASALSTAAARLVSSRVTCSPSSSFGRGASSLRATITSSLASPTVAQGAATARPSAPTTLIAPAPGPWVMSNSPKWAVSSGRMPT
jgi:hypothetical protein